MLNDDYRRVAVSTELAKENTSQVAPRAIVHALWYVNDGRWPTDTTMCGQAESLDVTHLPKERIVSCSACLAKLKKERQRRSAEGTMRHQERRREEIEAAVIEHASPDAELVDYMQRRAAELRERGYDGIANDLEIVAGRLAEHESIPHDSSVCQVGVDALTYIGPERRLRPRQINHTTEGDEL
jgi:hypothetical protein